MEQNCNPQQDHLHGVKQLKQRRGNVAKKISVWWGVQSGGTVYSFAIASPNNSRRRRRRQHGRCCFKFNEIGLSPLDRVTASMCLKTRVISHGKRKTAFSIFFFFTSVSLNSFNLIFYHIITPAFS